MTRKMEAVKAPEASPEPDNKQKKDERAQNEELLAGKEKPVKKPKTASMEKAEAKQKEEPAEKQASKAPEEKVHDEKADSKAEALKQEEKKYRYEATSRIVNMDLFGVVSSDIIYQIEEDQKEEDELFERLEEYRKNETILWGTVSGVELNTQGNKVIVVVMWENTRILIPENVFFEKNWDFGKEYKSLSEEEKLSRHIVAAREMLNANVPFVIKGVLRKTISEGSYKGEEEIVAVGDKSAAMGKLRDIYFYHRNTDSPIEVGINDQANANIIYVAEEFITVECLGVETRIDALRLGDSVGGNCGHYVKTGQVMRVGIKKVA